MRELGAEGQWLWKETTRMWLTDNWAPSLGLYQPPSSLPRLGLIKMNLAAC